MTFRLKYLQIQVGHRTDHSEAIVEDEHCCPMTNGNEPG